MGLFFRDVIDRAGQTRWRESEERLRAPFSSQAERSCIVVADLNGAFSGSEPERFCGHPRLFI